MSSENNIDKLFRDGLYNREVPYNSDDWSGALELLEGADSSKGLLFKFRKWLYGIGALLVALFVFLQFDFNGPSLDKSEAAVVSSSSSSNKMWRI